MHNRLAIIALAALSTSCAPDYYRFRFDPSPAEVVVQPPDDPVRARGLVSILDARRTPYAGSEAELRVRLRIENVSEQAISLELSDLELVASDLRSFGAPRVEPFQTQVRAGESAAWELFFPYPVGMSLEAPDIEGLNLRVGLTWDDGRVDVSVPFRRMWPATSTYPYYGNWSIGVGFGYCD